MPSLSSRHASIASIVVPIARRRGTRSRREARKVEKLKEITSLELRRAKGDHLDALQLAKLDRRSELERNTGAPQD